MRRLGVFGGGAPRTPPGVYGGAVAPVSPACVLGLAAPRFALVGSAPACWRGAGGAAPGRC